MFNSRSFINRLKARTQATLATIELLQRHITDNGGSPTIYDGLKAARIELNTLKWILREVERELEGHSAPEVPSGAASSSPLPITRKTTSKRS